MMRLAIAGIIALLFSLFFLRPVPQPHVESPAAPNCIEGQGRRITTTLIHVCLPPDAYASRTTVPPDEITDFWIPGLPEPLTVTHESALLEPVNERPSIKNAFCAGYPVVDTRWKRADGRLARQIRADRTSIGYKWTSAPVAANLDRILDTWSCR
ncbi:MAG: hypothetical protein HY646_14585 [Acidobacteria bacterium]|nr:hypothetical protein [Acidobacteriota bacterium]